MNSVKFGNKKHYKSTTSHQARYFNRIVSGRLTLIIKDTIS